MLAGIRVIKMYAWEAPFATLIQRVRASEVGKVFASNGLKGFNLAIFFSATALVSFLTFLPYNLGGNRLDVYTVFYTIALFSAARFTVALKIPLATQGLSELRVAAKRIEQLLLLEDFHALANVHTSSNKDDTFSELTLPLLSQPEPSTFTSTSESTVRNEFQDIDDMHTKSDAVPELALPLIVQPEPAASTMTSESTVPDTPLGTVRLERALCRWSPDAPPTLDDITLAVQPGELMGLVGPVGCGKSSLLLALLGELRTESGSVVVAGRVSYAPQVKEIGGNETEGER